MDKKLSVEYTRMIRKINTPSTVLSLEDNLN
jgi:hypothetical protein